jgi:glycosyltransferase involved in cell wall biosynthesis
MSQLRLVGFRYHPAIGGAEQFARRLILEIDGRLSVDVVTVVTNDRTDWLSLLIDGVRDTADCYQVDGRDVIALPRWPSEVRRRLRLLMPFYHLPSSPAPQLMARILAPQLEPVAQPAGIVHNVFMGREAFSLGLMEAAARTGTPFVFTPLRHERPLGWSSTAFREIYGRADAVIALSRTEADWLVAHGARPERTSVIGAGPLNDGDASPEPARQAVGPEPFVLFLGQLHAYKGFRVLLDAARQLRDRRDVRFVFAGPDVRQHARIFRDAGPNVIYLASVDDQLRDSLISACSVLCVPSSRESFGIVLVEAWNAGKPVIGGSARATQELIADGQDGFSVPQDASVLAERLRRLLDDDGLARAMGARGKTKVQQRFSWRAIADAHLEIYSRLLAERVPA